MEWVKIDDEGELVLVEDEVKLVPEVQALLSPKYNKKGRATQELKYLFLAYSYKSPYRDFSEKERLAEARLDCKFPEDWIESPELKALVPKFLRGTKSKITRLLDTVQKFLDKFEAYLDGINLDERTAAGGLVYSAKSVMETLERLPRLAETLQELENQARVGVITKVTSKGDHEVGMLGTGLMNVKSKREDESEEPNEDD